MKKAVFSIVFLVVFQVTLFSQLDHSCLPNGITFYNQQQINNFPSNFPNCTKIEGDLTISGGIKLDSLYVLNSVGGSLKMIYNGYLVSLSGLENISSLGGSLDISSNEILTNISGIRNIDATTITNLKISNNPSLSLCEIESICNYLDNPTGSVDIFRNAVGCNNPTEVANACGITLDCLPYGHYYLLSQDDVDSFKEDFPGCTEIEGKLTINGIDITNLTGLNLITSVSETLGLWFNESLTSLSGLENIEHVGDSLSIVSCHRLINLNGLDNLSTLDGSLEIDGNQQLISLEGLESLYSIGGSLVIGSWGYLGNYSLINLTGLDNLTSIGGILSIEYNPSLINLTGLNNLTSIGSKLLLKNNSSLSSFEGLNNVVSIDGGIDISSNNSITDLSGLNNLISTASVRIIENNSLTNLSGLNNLSTITGSLRLIDNDALLDITALNKLSSIGFSLLEIMANANLNDLEGLNNIEASSIKNLNIFYNSSLTTCEVQSVCDYLAAPNGEIEIHDNAPGCDSTEEVEYACQTVWVNERNPSNQPIIVYPNPFTTTTTITYKLQKPTAVQVIIFNHLGKQVEVIQQKQTAGQQQVVWNAERFPAGMYYFTLKAGEQMASGKMVVVR